MYESVKVIGMKAIALPFKALAILVLAAIVLSLLTWFLMAGLRMPALEAVDVFERGCLSYCAEIEAEAKVTGDVAGAAIRKAYALEGTAFIRACKELYPDVEFPYECWNRDCCKLTLPPLR